MYCFVSMVEHRTTCKFNSPRSSSRSQAGGWMTHFLLVITMEPTEMGAYEIRRAMKRATGCSESKSGR